MTRAEKDQVLGRAPTVFRLGHTLIALVELVGLGYVWTCALVRRRDRLLRFSVAALLVEGVALVIGRGNCPLGPLQRRLGDSVPLFEPVLAPRAAKAAVPVLATVSIAGLALLAVRPPLSEKDAQYDRARGVRDRSGV